MTTDNRTNEPTEAQVEAAAREWYEQANGYETWASASGKHQQVVKVRAARALVAAARVPVQGEPNDDREAVARAIAPDDWRLADAPQYAHLPQGARDSLTRQSLEAADRVIASRATVPDAATAALERVRVVLSNDELVWSDGSYTNVLVVEVKDVLAALDGAPEPEWEYGYRGRYAVMHPTKAGQRIETPEITQRTPDNWLPEMGEIYRRRPSTPAGPWEPIKGESE